MLLRWHFLLTNSTEIYLYLNENNHKKNSLRHSHESLSEGESFADQSSLHGRCPDLTSKFQCRVRPDEIVIAAKQLEMIFKKFLP